MMSFSPTEDPPEKTTRSLAIAFFNAARRASRRSNTRPRETGSPPFSRTTLAIVCELMSYTWPARIGRAARQTDPRRPGVRHQLAHDGERRPGERRRSRLPGPGVGPPRVPPRRVEESARERSRHLLGRILRRREGHHRRRAAVDGRAPVPRDRGEARQAHGPRTRQWEGGPRDARLSDIVSEQL